MGESIVPSSSTSRPAMAAWIMSGNKHVAKGATPRCATLLLIKKMDAQEIFVTDWCACSVHMQRAHACHLPLLDA
jgi:hypothetical protein